MKVYYSGGVTFQLKNRKYELMGPIIGVMIIFDDYLVIKSAAAYLSGLS